MSAGMATARPAAVVMSASEMPGATARRVAAPAVPRPWKASMMPMTVPKRPTKVAPLAMVASQVMRRLHRGEGFRGGGLGGALERDGVAGHAAAAGLALVLIVDLGEDGDERAGLELLGDGGDLGEAAGFAEGAEEALALLARAGEATPLGEHDGPGEDAGEQQDDEDGLGDGAGVADHLEECGAGRADRARKERRRGGVILEEVESEGEWGGETRQHHYRLL